MDLFSPHGRQFCSVPSQARPLVGSLRLPEWGCVVSLRELHDARAFRRAVHRLAAPGWRLLILRQAFIFLLGGLHFDDFSDYDTRDASPRNADRFLVAAAACRVLPSGLPTDEQIKRRCNTESLARGIAMLQALWFVLTLLPCLVGRLVTSPLEFVTMSYVFCGLAMYIAWNQCPQGVEEPFVIAAKGIKPQMAHGPEVLSVQVEGVKWTSDMHKAVYGTTIFLAFTCVHFAPRNYNFPTKVEVYLWRCSVLGTLVFGVLTFLLRDLRAKSPNPITPRNDLKTWTLGVLFVLYVT
ncbi:hypothetical protein SLS53_006047 [Cytospora paraplurivora]|uniref:Uncharacterized protein n=1 Tax=Cytospora paraplurivora TaxID=2898453 RepID=A0AAN9UC62_9PEZI